MPIMESDSESQDSDDGRRFRFEATRKDAVPSRSNTKRHSPIQERRKRRSRSRDRSRRDKSSDRSRHLKDDKIRSSNDRDSHSRHSARASDNGRESKSSKDMNTRHDRESRGRRERMRGSRRDSDKRDSHEKSQGDKSLKTRERAKQRSPERSRERSDQVVRKSTLEKSSRENSTQESVERKHNEKERKGVNLVDEEVSRNESKKVEKRKYPTEDPCKVNQRLDDQQSASNRFNPSDVSDSSLGVQNDDDSNHKKFKLSNSEETEADNSARDCKSADSYYGPALPPVMTKKPQVTNSPSSEAINFDKKCVDLPSGSIKRIIGPALPQNLEPQNRENETEGQETIGPVLPSNLQQKIIGPVIPENFVPAKDVEDNTEILKEDSEFSISDNFGPLPADHPDAKDSYVQMQLERRAIRIQEELLQKADMPEEKKREEWMTELPPVHAVALGLGPRTFKMKEGPDMSDRSCWTDTPSDKVRKEWEKEEGKFVSATVEKSNDSMSVEIIKPIEDRPGESLLDMHLKTIKKKKKQLEKEAKRLGLSTRRPFDRDIDLQTNQLNEARKKKIFDKAKFLNDRFAPGKI